MLGENESALSEPIRFGPNRIDSGLGSLIAETSVVFIDRFFQSAVVQGREVRIPFKQFTFQHFPWAERRIRNAFRVMLLEILPDARLLSGRLRNVLGAGIDVGRCRLRGRGRLRGRVSWSVHHEGGGNWWRLAKSSTASFMTTTRFNIQAWSDRHLKISRS